MPNDKTKNEIGFKIRRAFEGRENNLRTVKGVAQDTGLSEAEVQAYIERHKDWFKKSSLVPSGTYVLYELKKEEAL